MSWRENELAVGALAVQGYFDEDTKTLKQNMLAVQLRDVFLRKPIDASRDDILDKKTRLFQTGLTKLQLLDSILPEFRVKYQLSDEEQRALKKSPRDHPELEEREKAIAELSTLLWGTLAKTNRSGAVQALMVQRRMILIDAKGTRDGASVTVKAATDDQDLIIEYYVRPRGDQLVRISGGVRDDCSMVGMTFEGITERMKAELGVHVSTAVGNLLQVASPDFATLTGRPGKRPQAIATNTQKG